MFSTKFLGVWTLRKRCPSILYQFQPIGGNEGDGDGADAVDLDDDTAALLDASDSACATDELTIGDADGLTGLAEEGGVVFEVVGLVGVRGDSTDEVLHLTVGNGEDASSASSGARHRSSSAWPRKRADA